MPKRLTHVQLCCIHQVWSKDECIYIKDDKLRQQLTNAFLADKDLPAKIYRYQCVERTRLDYIKEHFIVEGGIPELELPWIQWFKRQGINIADFANDLAEILQCTQRRKMLRLVGPPQTGKTVLLKCIAQPFITGQIMISGQKLNTFDYEDLFGKSMGIIDEANFNNNTCIPLLSLSGGSELKVERKNRASAMLKPLPIVMTSNFYNWGIIINQSTAAALNSRCITKQINEREPPRYAPGKKRTFMGLYNLLFKNIVYAD